MLKKRRMVMRPRGATKSRGEAGNPEAQRDRKRMTNMIRTMTTAHGKVVKLTISSVFIKKPKRIKKSARIINVASKVISLNFLTSISNLSGLNLLIHLIFFISSRLPRNKPNTRIKSKPGKWRYLERP